MASKKHYYLTLDTETAGTLEQPYVYNIGGIIYDRAGTEYERFSFVIKEVYKGMPEKMSTAYYKEKLPQYEKALAEGQTKMISIWEAKKYIESICKEFDIKAIIAHNGRFDNHALNHTISYFSCGCVTHFYPYSVEKWDTLAMARSVLGKMPTYKKFCQENNYLTSNKQYRYTAEILYRFISEEKDFIEKHTALADCEIEKEILLYCLRQHKKMTKTWYSEEKFQEAKQELQKEVMMECNMREVVQKLNVSQMKELLDK